MPIKAIKIKNFKSLKNIKIDFGNKRYDLCCITGRNGAGKSSILQCIKYFYDNLIYNNIDRNVIDNSNPYISKMEIHVVYDISLLSKKNTNNFISNQLKEIKQYQNLNGEIHIKFTQYKDNTIKIYPNNKTLLKFIYKNFPVYFIDTRFIKLENWEDIWDIISEMSLTNIKVTEEQLAASLDETYSKAYGEKYSKIINIIDSIFNNKSITTNRYEYNTRYKDMLISRLGGKEFIRNGNTLDYYSDGLNSFSFIELLMKLISELSTTGLKEPIIMIDELEIGLHPQYINSLIKTIMDSLNKNMRVIISTHSPSIITELVKCNKEVLMLRAGREKSFTTLDIVKDVISKENKYLFTVNEACCYFSNMLVFVEGASEVQLLFHEKIRKLFPILNNVDIYPYNSNNDKLKFIKPSNVNYKIPYLLIVDMDKILKCSIDTSIKKEKFKNNSDGLVNPLYDMELKTKEKLLYYNESTGRKISTYHLRMYIEGFLNRYRFKLSEESYSIEDDSYNKLINAIRYYCVQYNVFPVSTTIEGTLINLKNIDKFIKWIKESKKLDETKLDSLILMKSKKFQVTILRLIFNGKYDNLKTFGEGKGNIGDAILSKDIENKIEELKKQAGGKTDGWIIEFIDYYFSNYIDIINDEKTRLEKFKSDFEEVYKILRVIEIMEKVKKVW